MSAQSSTIVVTGGAGFLGRCMVEVLKAQGYRPVVIDNFATSSRLSLQGVDYYEWDLTHSGEGARFPLCEGAHAVIHFAARALVEESVQHPNLYLENNVGSARGIRELCRIWGVRLLIHSSSCAVYGIPERVPTPEDQRLAPISPYGESKVRAEEVFNEASVRGDLYSMNLRYFNPVGALGGVGEDHHPETHLIPRVVAALMNGEAINVFGSDYPTQDGTCVRDFIHVGDLLEGHLAALKVLERDSGFPRAINLGTEIGCSVLEVIRTAELVTGLKGVVNFQKRRVGDPPKLVADIEMARNVLGWTPRCGLGEMIQDHWNHVRRRK